MFYRHWKSRLTYYYVRHRRKTAACIFFVILKVFLVGLFVLLAENVTSVKRTPSSKPAITRRPVDASRYVASTDDIKRFTRLGNQLFNFAGVVFVAELTRRQPAVENTDYETRLEEAFQLNVERFDQLCPCHTVGEKRLAAYDKDTEREVLMNGSRTFDDKAILVAGFRQSWKYTSAVEQRIRQHLVFRSEIRSFALKFHADNVPPGWNRVGFVRVGIHVRRGDYLIYSDKGYTVPTVSYFRKAMKYFTDMFDRVQFFVASDDPLWIKANINTVGHSPAVVNVTHSSGHSPGQDLAILSLCEHVIMSTGTFGWWAAWLAKGVTIYYGEFPRRGSPLEKVFERKDFFPPHWIPMTD